MFQGQFLNVIGLVFYGTNYYVSKHGLLIWLTDIFNTQFHN